ncbi:MAG: NADH-quinone oxidoreductase subunit C [Pseudomonadota bacterium]|nr:MAG: NADH-quinone oxidoreductase subunit C [Pseudomonadota bacterium]
MPRSTSLAPAALIGVRAEDWDRVGQEAKASDCRWVAAWGEDCGQQFTINVCLYKPSDYLVVRTTVERATPVLASHTPYFPAADRPERHIQDMFGVAFMDHPDTRRWTRHQAWSDKEFPLRKEFPAAGGIAGSTPPDDQYRFLSAQGAGVYEIPVGPVHAGIIEPGHFRFQAVGELVLNLEEHLGYVHKGIEKIAEGRDAAGLARLAGRVSGDSTVAHTWAACMAMERAAGVTPPERALYLRALMCERERVVNHLGDIGAVLNDVAFAFGFYQFGRLREDWTRLSGQAFGHRFMMDRIVPGGVTTNIEQSAIDAMRQQARALPEELTKLMAIVDDNASIEDRLETTGVLSLELAKALGCVGYVGRASGQPFDVRRDVSYAPYDRLTVKVPLYRYGDVAARVKVRAEECLASCELIAQLLDTLPSGALKATWSAPSSTVEGVGMIDGWRGEIISYVRFAADGRIARFFPRDPSWTTWPALEKLVRDNIVPDFPVCNKSVNGSYSGHDL